MSSYVEQLEQDRQRVERALEGLIAQQEQRLEELNQALVSYMGFLDKLIVRTIVFRTTYGAGAQETLVAETDVEEASKPVTETGRQIERETHLLDAYRTALGRVQSGASLEGMGEPQT